MINFAKVGVDRSNPFARSNFLWEVNDLPCIEWPSS
jgi:hypothetical protein